MLCRWTVWQEGSRGEAGRALRPTRRSCGRGARVLPGQPGPQRLRSAFAAPDPGPCPCRGWASRGQVVRNRRAPVPALARTMSQQVQRGGDNIQGAEGLIPPKVLEPRLDILGRGRGPVRYGGAISTHRRMSSCPSDRMKCARRARMISRPAMACASSGEALGPS